MLSIENDISIMVFVDQTMIQTIKGHFVTTLDDMMASPPVFPTTCRFVN